MTSQGTNRFRQAVSSACLFSACLFLLADASPVFGQQKRYRPPPDYVQLYRPDQSEGRRVLDEFRGASVRDGYYLEFLLRVLPRRGQERTIRGRLWESMIDGSANRRLELNPQTNESRGEASRLLIRDGLFPALWQWKAGAMSPLTGKALFDPLGGTNLTAFDLQMPFLTWPDVEFEGVRKVRGRPSHSFLFYPPADYGQWQPSLSGVRVFLDTQYNALVQVEQLGEGGRLTKTMSVLELKKLGEDWIVKTVDVRDEVSRNKTRFVVTSAALRQDFSAPVFSPEELGAPLEPPQIGLIRIDP